MTNFNNNTMMVNTKNKEENKMIELNEKRELMMMAIEGELMQEVIDMVQVEEYEELLAGIEWEIIELLNAYEEQALEEEYEMKEKVKLESFESQLKRRAVKESLAISTNNELEEKANNRKEFLKTLLAEKLNPKVSERRKKRLKIYGEPQEEKQIVEQLLTLNTSEESSKNEADLLTSDTTHVSDYDNQIKEKLFRNYTLKKRRDVVYNKLKEVKERGIVIRGEIKFNKYYGYHEGTFFILDDELVFFKFDNKHEQYKNWIYTAKSIEKIYFPDATKLGDWEIDHGLLCVSKTNGTVEYSSYAVTTSEYDLDVFTY